MRISRVGTSNSPRPQGFTLLEIVVVILIMGLLLLLVYPKVQVLTEDGLRTGSRELVGAIQRLYHESMATRQVHRLTYGIRTGVYRVQTVDPRQSPSAFAAEEGRLSAMPRGVLFQDVVTVRQGKVTEGEAFTHFYPTGLAENTVIHLTDGDRRSVTLAVNPLTGRVKVLDGYVEFEKRGE